MFYGATVMASAARITHTLHHFQLSVIKVPTSIKEFEREREKTQSERERG